MKKKYENLKNNYLRKITIILFFLNGCLLFSQTIDIESFKGNPFKVSGGLSAGATFFQSQRESRQPFVYNLIGNLNLSVYNFSFPVSYTITNLGGNLNYNIPFNFNRFSINPKYKWISAYAGDINLNFSPYTYAGHQFTGGAVELTPNGALKIAALAGKFLKATEDDGNPNSLPAYERWGYGLKADYAFSKYKFGIATFYAKDNQNSVAFIAPSRNIFPQENFAIGVLAEGQITKEIKAFVDFTNSTLVTDTRAIGNYNQGVASVFFNPNASSKNFNALKVGFDFKVQKSTLGLSYERVDPEYKTLGAFFFSNDLENFMANISKPFLKDKVTLNLNLGFQRDNLNKTKEQTNTRLVTNLSTNIKITDKWNVTANFSNQNSVSNVNPDQFVQINQQNPELQSVQQLNYRQLSRSASFNSSYAFEKTKKSQKSINGNYNFNQVANEQGGLIRKGQLSNFHNLNLGYGHQFLKSKWSANASVNVTINQIGTQNTTTFGPVLSASKKFLKDKLNTSFGTAVNTTNGEAKSGFNFNIRANASYKYLDNHNFNLSATQLVSNNKTQTQSTSLNELTVNMTYAYNFNSFKKNKKEEKKLQVEDLEKPTIGVKLNQKIKELDTALIQKEVQDKFNAYPIEHLLDYKNVVTAQKDSVFAKITKFDTAQNEAVKEKLANNISKEVNQFEKLINQYIDFDQKYNELYQTAINELYQKTKQRELFGKKYFERKYNMPLSNDNNTAIEDVDKIVKYIVDNNIAISKRDALELSQIKMLFELTTFMNDNKPAVSQSFIETKEDQKQKYFEMYQKGKDISKEKEVLFVNILQQYNTAFLKPIGSQIKK